MPVDFAAADVLGELRVEFGRDDADASAGSEERRDLLRGDGAATDDDNEAVFEFKEGGKEGHGMILSEGAGSWGETSWFKFCHDPSTARRLECSGAPVGMASQEEVETQEPT